MTSRFPGNAESAMVGAMKPGGSLQPNGERIQEPVMPVEHVADAVVHMASLPLNVNILNTVRWPFQHLPSRVTPRG